jgi:ADP-ribose pyrophosphatase YjhB (NUDIX family)
VREVQEETGINIQTKLDTRNKIEFDCHGGISIFYVARGVSEQERTKIDNKEIDEITWMRLEEVRRGQNKFVERSRVAWSSYERDFSRKDTSDLYMPKYSKKDSEAFDYSACPLLKFKLDKNKLNDVLFGPLRR